MKWKNTMHKPSLKGALDGITVLDMSRLLPGPYCSMILADHGARVIMIEDRRYEPESGFPKLTLRNKEHMALNLKSDEGRAVFFKMVEKADVVLEGFRPGVVEKLGVDYKSVRAVNPGIVYCSITGFGQTGPLKDRPGHDVNYMAESGLLSLIGDENRPPAIPGFQVADIAGGGLNGAVGILLALQARTKTGQGQYIDISMTDGCAALLTLALDFRQMSGQPLVRSQSVLSHRYAFYNTYETADHRYLSLGCLEPRFWTRLCQCLEREEWMTLQFDETRRLEIIDSMRSLIKDRPLSHWVETFDGQDICWGAVNSLDDIMESPLFKEREMVADYTADNGKTEKTLGIPVKLSDTPGSLRTPPTSFGKDTESILREFGYSDREIVYLKEKKII